MKLLNEIPVLKKCCFCLPLRHGLIVWGCFKLIADAFFITVLSIFVSQAALMVKALGLNEAVLTMISIEVILPVIAFAVIIVDFIVTLSFVFRGLEKNLKLTQVFCFINIVMWILSLLVVVTIIVIAVQSGADILEGAFYFLNLAVQTYFLLLLRSEIIQLKKIDESSSQNNAVEEESTKKCEEIVAGEEVGKEVV